MKRPLQLILSLSLIIATIASSTTCLKAFQTKPEEVVIAANKQANSMINVANSEANAIIANADAESAEIIDAAQKEKERKIAEAKAKAEAEAKKKKLSSGSGRAFITFPLKLSEADKDILYRICYAEDGVGGKKGMQAVCWVVLNRVASKNFPNTIKGVVYAPGQFDPVRNGSINKKPSKTCIDAVDEVLAGKVPDPTNGALYFAMDYADNGSWWRSLTYCGHIGSHNFYK